MGEESVILGKVLDVLDLFMQKVDVLGTGISDLRVALSEIKTHDAPCKFLENHEKRTEVELKDITKKQSRDIRDIHNKVETHVRECHSSNSASSEGKFMADHVNEYHSAKSTRDNWGAYAAVLCAVATAAMMVIMLVK